MKTILITGASSGIGRACAELLAKGNRLILCSRKKNILNDIASNFESALTYELDVRNYGEIKQMFQELANKNVIPDVLINSAGLAIGLDELDKGEIKEWDEMIDTNIKGLLYVSKFALKYMKQINCGHIINIGSIAGIDSYSKGVVYAASKAAVKSISDGLRKEVVAYNIKVTNIQPGLVETNFSNIRFRGDKTRAKEVYKGIDPLIPKDIADLVKYAIEAPKHVQINEITITPVHQASVEIIHRKI